MSVIYIAGPITGEPDYRENFDRVDRMLSENHIVFNPAFMPEGLPHDAYMPICYAMIDACNTVYFLHGWENSKGARMEFEYATAKGMKIEFEKC